MANKILQNADLLKRELDAARKRLIDQDKLVKDCQDGLASAIASGLKSTETVYRGRLPRLQKSAGATRSLVDELEKALGSLPL